MPKHHPRTACDWENKAGILTQWVFTPAATGKTFGRDWSSTKALKCTGPFKKDVGAAIVEMLDIDLSGIPLHPVLDRAYMDAVMKAAQKKPLSAQQ